MLLRLAKTFAVLICLLASRPTVAAFGFAPGDIYTGEVLSNGASGVVLNITPCSADKSIKTMKTFRLKDLGEETCPGPHGRKYRKVQIEEVAPAPVPPPKPTAKPKTPQNE